MNHGGGEPSLASLIERSAELKRALVDFALSPRFERHLEQFMLEAADPYQELSEGEAIGVIDRFALQHFLPNAKTVHGLTQDEIFPAIDAGKRQYRPAAMHENPWLRLLRREVEDLARTLHGERYLREQQARTELVRINRELKQLCAQLAALGERRAALLSELGEQDSPRQ